MARYLLLTIAFLIAGFAAMAQTSIQGSVKDADSGEPIILGTVALYRNGVLITGSETDFDGFYSITEIDPGSYDVVFSYTGYQETRIEGVTVSAGKANRLDAKLSAGVTLEEIVVKYEKPLIEQDNTTQGNTLSSEQIKNLPTRDVNALASLGAGIASADEGGALSIRGSRSDATNYYIDGVRVSGRMVPKQQIEQLQVITGGVEARYGDVTGGIISVTTKGPSEKFGGGLELETSKFLDPYDQRLGSLTLSGPLLKSKGKTILGYRLGGQYTYNKDDDPPATSIYVVKDEIRDALEQQPIRLVGNTAKPAAEVLTNDDVDKLDARPNEERHTVDLTAKLDANLGKSIDVTFSGTYYNIRDKFTPGGWQVYNSHYNPTSDNTRYRGNFRLRHRLGTTSTNEETQKGSLIQNAVYVLQFGYEKSLTEVADKRHGDNLFNYGYIGNYDLQWTPFIDFTPSFIGDSIFVQYDYTHTDYTREFFGYTPNTDINPVLTRYIPNPEDNDDFADFDVLNGRIPGFLGNVWTNLHTNIGAVYNLNRKRDSDLYTFNANTSFELVPKGSGSARHNIQFGLLYEQTVSRGYDISPNQLWTLARLLANQHLDGQAVDTTNIVGTFTRPYLALDAFTGDTLLYVPDSAYALYAPGVQLDVTDKQFYKNVRDVFGAPINQYVNIDGLNPNDLSLSMFSARELNDFGLGLNYWGYDYLGNKLDGITFEDFFTAEDANGIRTFPVAAFQPNYQAAFIQDKFTFKDVIFRVGLRVDRFDANNKVLKDPYSLYDVITAGDFKTRFNKTTPGNIGDDFKVYVTSDGGETVQAYRDGDTWYFPSGQPANDGSEVFGGNLVYPRYAEDDEMKRNITSKGFDPDISFEDYEPQINWMPRLAFSFPISEEANFFAHYDVLVQRPPSNSFVSPLTYFYWETNGSGLRANANLKPERTVDYEVGFQQKLSNSTALKISAYYKELRDMIQSRFILFVPAPVNAYETYDNLDFATVKGFSISYDMRRTGNISMNLSYTLQFADGTGSDANSSRGIGGTGIQRTLFPMSYDERHRISGIFDYRYGSGRSYNGPSIGGVDILANTGLNITGIAVSGRPYTSALQPEILGSSGIKGSINGSRLPWNLTVNAQIDKSFNITKPGSTSSLGLNIYLRVSNVFDRRNIQSVYRFTGSPKDDGFLNSARGTAFLAGGFNQGESQESFLAHYSWNLLNPDNYSLPRRIYLGAIFDF
jgi:outer membrane receptor protein involved in Fe transport